MSTDPYKALGIKNDASQDQLQKAYRRLAKRLHPDLNPGDKNAEEKFKAVAAAYDLLSDPEKRARFDRGEIDASGAERPRHRFYRDYAERAGSSNPYANDTAFSDFAGSDDILSEIFGRGRRANLPLRGEDIHYRLPVGFLDAVNGATQQVTLSDGSPLKVIIPPGTRDGQILRLRGKGGPGLNGGPPGDALVEIEVSPHPLFSRKGDDIYLELPISLAEAVLGGRVVAPTLTGEVTLTVPKWSNTGKVLRLRGKGVLRPDGSRGDEYVTLKPVLPEQPDPELESFVQSWRAGKAHDPRRMIAA